MMFGLGLAIGIVIGLAGAIFGMSLGEASKRADKWSEIYEVLRRNNELKESERDRTEG